MELTRDWVTVRASILLTFAVAILSILAGLAQIGGSASTVRCPCTCPRSPDRRVHWDDNRFLDARGAASRCGTATASVGPGGGPLPTAIQGLMQASVLSFPLVALSIVSMPALAYNRGRFDRPFSPSPTQLAAGAALVTAISYGTIGTYALRDQFNGVETIVDAFYFTVVTASTVGYGDVTPVAGAAADIAQLFVLSSLVMNVAAFAVALGVILTPAIEAQLSKALGKMTDKQIDLLDDHVLVLGYGDPDPIRSKNSTPATGTKYAVVTTDETAEARRLSERDVPVFTADPSDVDPLERVNIQGARGSSSQRTTTRGMRSRSSPPDNSTPTCGSSLRVTQRENVNKLRRAGADQVISPATLGGHILIDCAFGADSEDATTDLLGDSIDDVEELDDSSA